MRAGPIVAGALLLLIGLLLSLAVIGVPIALVGFVMIVLGLSTGDTKVMAGGSGQRQVIVTPAPASYQQAPARLPQQFAGDAKSCIKCGQMPRPTDIFCSRCGQRILSIQRLVRVGEELDNAIASGARLVRYLSDGKQAIVERV